MRSHPWYPRLSAGSRVVLAAVASLALFAAGCTPRDPDAAERGSPGAVGAPGSPPAVGMAAPRSGVSPAIDVGGVMSRTRRRFHPAADGWRGGLGAYAVHATAHDLAITPVRYQAAAATDSLFEDLGERRPRPAAQRGAPVTLRTASITRGDSLIARASDVAAARVEADGHLAIERGQAVEHLRITEEGVEQSFSFTKRPEGSGDLVIRIHVAGLRPAGETAGGHHFVDPVSTLGVRYGAATWIDARGARTSVAVRYAAASGELALSVPGAVLDASVYPATLDPLISPESDVDAPLFDSHAYDTQLDAAVAWNGAAYLVVWEDHRDSPDGDTCEVHGVLVSPDGSLPLPQGITFSTNEGQDVAPAVGASGETFLVAWGSTDAAGARDLQGARVSGAGALLDAMPLEISSAPADQRRPDVSGSSDGFFVAWEDLRNGGSNDIYGARVSPEGVVLDPGGVVVSSASADQSRPAMALNGTDFLVVWHDLRNGSRDIYGARVSPAGATLDPDGIAITTAPSGQMFPDVASGSGDAMVVWRDYRDGNHDIYGARVNPAGAVLDAGGITISTHSAKQEQPTVAFGAGSYLVAWRDDRIDFIGDIYGARVSPAGVNLDPNGLVLASGATLARSPAVASAGDGWLVAWDEGERIGSVVEDIRGARVTEAGDVLDPGGVLLSRGDRAERAHASVWNGTSYLVVWEEGVNGSSAIYGARMSPAGAILDADPILITTTSLVHEVSAASNGADFMVVWTEYDPAMSTNRILEKRISAAGAVLDPVPIVLEPALDEPGGIDVLHGGGSYLIVWSRSLEVVGARVSAAGAVLDALPFPISAANSFKRDPALAFQGAEFFVVWWSALDSGNIFGARVSTGGVVLNPEDLPITSEYGYAWSPSIAFDGSSYRVLWAQEGSRRPAELFVTRLSTAGAVLDPPGPAIIASSGLGQYRSRLVCDAAVCLAVWKSQAFWSSGGTDLHGAWIDVDAVSAPAQPFLIAASTSPARRPSAATSGANQFFVFDDRVDAVAGSPQAKARFVSRPLVGACQVDLDCATGFCVDSFCCDSACGGAPDDCQVCSVAEGAAVDGVCAPLDSVSCEDGNTCSETGTCQEGTCIAPLKPDGALCPDGVCLGGMCETGAGGQGGAAGAGGQGGAGGQEPAGNGGAGGSGGPDPGSGCDCHAAGRRGSIPPIGGLVFIALLLIARKRR